MKNSVPSWCGENVVEWNNHLGLPSFKPKHGSLPVTHRCDGVVQRRHMVMGSTVYIVKYFSFPFLVVRSVLSLDSVRLKYIFSKLNWVPDYTREYINSSAYVVVAERHIVQVGVSWTEVPIFKKN